MDDPNVVTKRRVLGDDNTTELTARARAKLDDHAAFDADLRRAAQGGTLSAEDSRGIARAMAAEARAQESPPSSKVTVNKSELIVGLSEVITTDHQIPEADVREIVRAVENALPEETSHEELQRVLGQILEEYKQWKAKQIKNGLEIQRRLATHLGGDVAAAQRMHETGMGYYGARDVGKAAYATGKFAARAVAERSRAYAQEKVEYARQKHLSIQAFGHLLKTAASAESSFSDKRMAFAGMGSMIKDAFQRNKQEEEQEKSLLQQQLALIQEQREALRNSTNPEDKLKEIELLTRQQHVEDEIKKKDEERSDEENKEKTEKKENWKGRGKTAWGGIKGGFGLAKSGITGAVRSFGLFVVIALVVHLLNVTIFLYSPVINLIFALLLFFYFYQRDFKSIPFIIVGFLLSTFYIQSLLSNLVKGIEANIFIAPIYAFPWLWAWYIIIDALYRDTVLKDKENPSTKIWATYMFAYVVFLLFTPGFQGAFQGWMGNVDLPDEQQQLIAQGTVSKSQLGLFWSSTVSCIGGLFSADATACENFGKPPKENKSQEPLLSGGIDTTKEEAVTVDIIAPRYSIDVYQGDPVFVDFHPVVSVTQDVLFSFGCKVEDIYTENTPFADPTEWQVSVPKGFTNPPATKENTVVICTFPKQTLGLENGANKLTFNARMTDGQLKVESKYVLYFIEQTALDEWKTRFTTDPEFNTAEEEYNKRITRHQTEEDLVAAEVYKYQQLFPGVIENDYKKGKVESKSDPGFIKLIVVPDPRVVVGVKNSTLVKLKIAVENMVPNGKLLALTSGSVTIPSWLVPATNCQLLDPASKICQQKTCTYPMKKESLQRYSQKSLEEIAYGKQKSLDYCTLEVQGQPALANQNNLNSEIIDVSLSYDYEVESSASIVAHDVPDAELYDTEKATIGIPASGSMWERAITTQDPTADNRVYYDLILDYVSQDGSYASEKKGADLVAGLIAQESAFNYKAGSPTGCYGLGQFCYSTACEYQKAPYLLCARSDDSSRGCGGACEPCDEQCELVKGRDNRAVPHRSIQATVNYLAKLRKSYVGYKDQDKFAVAAYNIGEKVITTAILETREADPTWDRVYHEITPEFLLQFPGYSGTFTTSSGKTKAWDDSMRKNKVKEVGTHVARVMYYYEDFSTKEMPSFS
ncbi:transglycosylase SLT domain-containing protein [Candidatus Woesearchaeota archaeon]|nr:transglycosylase SLT domain-containing protein [Candidatus Woesearchaeota archaeon]